MSIWLSLNGGYWIIGEVVTWLCLLELSRLICTTRLTLDYSFYDKLVRSPKSLINAFDSSVDFVFSRTLGSRSDWEEDPDVSCYSDLSTLADSCRGFGLFIMKAFVRFTRALSDLDVVFLKIVFMRMWSLMNFTMSNSCESLPKAVDLIDLTSSRGLFLGLEQAILLRTAIK
jgi:hypothetical protein